jgi:hypothetical protein
MFYTEQVCFMVRYCTKLPKCFRPIVTSLRAAIAQSAKRLATAWTIRVWNPGGGQIFRTRPDRPWGPPSLLYNRYRASFPGVKRPGRGIDHPPHLMPRLHLHFSKNSVSIFFDWTYKMLTLRGNGTPVLSIGRTEVKGDPERILPNLLNIIYGRLQIWCKNCTWIVLMANKISFRIAEVHLRLLSKYNECL